MNAPVRELVLRNARIVLANEVVTGDLAIRDGTITGVSSSAYSSRGENIEGDLLIPGLVELHTDHFESHLFPRPGVAWPVLPALIAHDAQVAASGITTVFDALRAGSFDPSEKHAPGVLAQTIHDAKAIGVLRCDHFIHVRCELPCPDTVDDLEDIANAGDVRLVSIMDHTPGARQFTSLDKFREYYIGKKLISADRIEGYIADKLRLQEAHAAGNKEAILALVSGLGVRLASHDDATSAHVDEAVADGVHIAEFPTTAEAAAAAHAHGLAVLMGAPNLVRGGSHSGNISAREVAESGYLDILSSDYVPSSLLDAALSLADGPNATPLSDAIRTVTAAPAVAVGLADRGEIAPGKRADLVQVRLVAGRPVVRAVWRGGVRTL